jgi:hypothetical protein
MGSDQDRTRLENSIAELENTLEHQRLTPDTRAAAFAAVTQSRALLYMADILHSAVQTLVHDGLRPLMGRLPDR